MTRRRSTQAGLPLSRHIGDAGRLAASDAYAEMRTRLDYRHRQQDGVSDHGSRQRTLDELEAAAAASYAARSKRMAEAWRQR